MKIFKIKPSKTDYLDSMLPTNRKEVFFDVFKLHWKTLLLLGIIVLTFCLPFIFIEVFKYFALMNVEQNENTLMNSILITNISNLIKVPFFLLFGLVLSGIIRIVRQFCWIENVTMSYDFFLGIKQNIKQVILLMLSLAILWYLSTYCLNISYISENIMKYILVLPIGLFVFVILPIAGYTLVAIATYNNTIIQNFKIAFLVYAVNPFKVIMFTLLVLIFFGIRLIPLGIYFQAIFEVIGYVLLPVSLIIFFLFTNKQFDKNINEKYYPELLNKGIYKLK